MTAALGALLGWFALTAIVGVALALVAARRLVLHRRAAGVREEVRLGTRRWTPGLTLAVIPSGGDDEVLETVSSAIALDLPGLEIVVVVDVTRASLIAALTRSFDFRKSSRVYRHEIRTLFVRTICVSRKHPRLLLVEKNEASAADAINAAVNLARNQLFAFVSAGMRIDGAALSRMLDAFSAQPDSTLAVAAPVRPAGAGVPDLFHYASRLELTLPAGDGWTGLAAAASSSGAFLVWRKRLVEVAGGFRPGSRPVRMDAGLRFPDKLRVHAADGPILLLPEPAAWENPDSSVGWIAHHHAALAESLGRYGRRLFLAGPWRARLAVVYLALFEYLAPFIEAAALVALPTLLFLRQIDPALFGLGMALLGGGPMLRAGISTLAECSNRDRIDADHAARRFLGVLLSPLLFHPLATFARVWSLVRTSPHAAPARPVLSSLPAPSPTPPPNIPSPVSPAHPGVLRPSSGISTAPPPIAWAAPSVTDNSTPQKAVSPSREPSLDDELASLDLPDEREDDRR